MTYATSRFWPRHFVVCFDEARGEQFRALRCTTSAMAASTREKTLSADDCKYARILLQADAQIVFTMDD